MILIDLQKVLDSIVPDRVALANSQSAQVAILSQDALDISPLDHKAAQLRLQRSARKVEALDAALDKLRALDVYEIDDGALPVTMPNPLAGD